MRTYIKEIKYMEQKIQRCEIAYGALFNTVYGYLDDGKAIIVGHYWHEENVDAKEEDFVGLTVAEATELLSQKRQLKV